MAEASVSPISGGPAARPLAGKVAIVTGGGRGLGRAYVLRLAELGAAVAVVDVDLHSFKDFGADVEGMTADTSVEEARQLGVESFGVEANVADEQAMLALADEVLGRFGRIHIAVCNAGGGSGDLSGNKASQIDRTQLAAVMDRNLLGTINTCSAVAPAMKEQRYGKIVTTASILGLHPRSNGSYTHYSVAKAGVVMYTRALAAELGPYGITVNAISPGGISTGRAKHLMAGEVEAAHVAATPMRRMGLPEDCANVVEFLTSDHSSYVTGHVVPCDGGGIMPADYTGDE